MTIGGEGEKGGSGSGEVGLDVRTRKPVLKPSPKRKRRLLLPSSIPSPHLWQELYTQGRKRGGWREQQACPCWYPITGTSMRKADEEPVVPP